MDISFLTMLPQFQQLSEEKKQFMIEFAMADHGNNANSAAQSLMQAIQTAKGKNISFSKEESSLLIEVLKQNMSKEEATRTDKMLKMAQQFLMMQQMKKRLQKKSCENKSRISTALLSFIFISLRY